MNSLVLLMLGAVLADAAFRNGGNDAPAWNLCLLAVGLLTLLHTGLSWQKKHAAPLSAALLWPLILLPVYVAMQLIPLPVDLLAILSPARAEMVRAMARVVPDTIAAPLSIAPTATLGHLMRLCAYSAVFLLVRETVSRLGRRAWLASLPFVAVAGVEAVVGLMQTVAIPGDGYATGTYVNRVHFATLLEMTLPFAAALPLVLLRRYRGASGLPRVLPGVAAAQIAMAGLGALCIFLAIVYSLSRMALCGTFVSLAMLILLGRQAGIGRRAWLAAGASAVSIGIVAFATVPPSQAIARFVVAASQPGGLFLDRWPIWEETVRLAVSYPVFGCGFGAREFAYLRYKTEFRMFTSDFAHNDFLQLLAELGAVGFLIAAALGAAVMRTSWRAAGGQTEVRVRNMAFAALAAMVAIFLHSLVDFNLYVPANALLLAWIAGMACGLRGGPPV